MLTPLTVLQIANEDPRGLELAASIRRMHAETGEGYLDLWVKARDLGWIEATDDELAELALVTDTTTDAGEP